MRENRGGARGWLGFLASARDAGHATEFAAERTAVTRVMHHGSVAEKRACDVFFRFLEPMIRHPRIIGGRADGAIFGVHDHAEIVFIRDAGDRTHCLRSEAAMLAQNAK